MLTTSYGPAVETGKIDIVLFFKLLYILRFIGFLLKKWGTPHEATSPERLSLLKFGSEQQKN